MRVALAIAFLCSCAPCRDAAVAEWAISDGEYDADDPAVVAVVLRGDVVCTGTAIAPRVVLTAAHCIAGEPFADLAVATGPSVEDRPRFAVSHAKVHPRFEEAFLTTDVGLLRLEEPLLAADALPLLRRAPLEEEAISAEVRIVGYGADESSPGGMRKREGFAVLEEIRASELTVAPGPSLPCSGDSGGPAFLTVDGVEELVGVTSNGDPDCARAASYGRVDVHESDFIAPYLAETAGGAAPACAISGATAGIAPWPLVLALVYLRRPKRRRSSRNRLMKSR